MTDKIAYANSVDQDQTAPEGAFWSGSTLFAIQLSILKKTTAQKKQKFDQNKNGIKCSKF